MSSKGRQGLERGAYTMSQVQIVYGSPDVMLPPIHGFRGHVWSLAQFFKHFVIWLVSKGHKNLYQLFYLLWKLWDSKVTFRQSAVPD